MNKFTGIDMEESAIFDKFTEQCREFTAMKTAVCFPCSDVALAGAVDAANAGLIDPVFVGPRAKIEAVALASNIDLRPFQLIEAANEREAAALSVALCRSGETAALMKGSLHTDTFMRAVLRKENGLGGTSRISHVFVLDAPLYSRTLMITDAAINICPGLEEKVDIVQNAIDLAHALGVPCPKVAILSAVETVNPKIVSTVDAAALCKMADRGQITGGILDGPLAFDTAVSAEAAAIKNLVSPIAGEADILVVPDLESGNMLAKQLEYLGGAQMAGIVVGAKVPIILTSRADSAQSRLASCAVASLLANAKQESDV
ncbi:MAG: bifunctional enoyl-CoA hydratase/phosphate acetyltransferase [Acidobacteriaceae bacterium]